MPAPIGKLAAELLHNPVTIDLERRSAPAVGITQAIYPVAQDLKTSLFLALLERGDMKEALVFTRTKHRANRLAEQLVKRGISAERIHGNRSQSARTAALAGFKNGTIRVLVATDIAARGIDIEALGHVVNFDVPTAPEDYIHRVGRTARAELTGEAFTLVAPDEEQGAARHREGDQAVACRACCSPTSTTRPSRASSSKCRSRIASPRSASARPRSAPAPPRRWRARRRGPSGQAGVRPPAARRGRSSRGGGRWSGGVTWRLGAGRRLRAPASAASSAPATSAPRRRQHVHVGVRTAMVRRRRAPAVRPAKQRQRHWWQRRFRQWPAPRWLAAVAAARTTDMVRVLPSPTLPSGEKGGGRGSARRPGGESTTPGDTKRAWAEARALIWSHRRSVGIGLVLMLHQPRGRLRAARSAPST